MERGSDCCYLLYYLWCKWLKGLGGCSFFFFKVLFPFPENRKYLIPMLILTSVLCFQLISCICFPPFFWAMSSPERNEDAGSEHVGQSPRETGT